MRDDRCETCRYSQPEGGGFECREGPPQIVFNPAAGTYGVAFPTLNEGEWCHRWRVKLIQPEEPYNHIGWKCTQCGTQNFNDDLPCRRCGVRVT